MVVRTFPRRVPIRVPGYSGKPRISSKKSAASATDVGDQVAQLLEDDRAGAAAATSRERAVCRTRGLRKGARGRVSWACSERRVGDGTLTCLKIALCGPRDVLLRQPGQVDAYARAVGPLRATTLLNGTVTSLKLKTRNAQTSLSIEPLVETQPLDGMV